MQNYAYVSAFINRIQSLLKEETHSRNVVKLLHKLK
jgi:hypothetical protein